MEDVEDRVVVEFVLKEFIKLLLEKDVFFVFKVVDFVVMNGKYLEDEDLIFVEERLDLKDSEIFKMVEMYKLVVEGIEVIISYYEWIFVMVIG